MGGQDGCTSISYSESCGQESRRRTLFGHLPFGYSFWPGFESRLTRFSVPLHFEPQEPALQIALLRLSPLEANEYIAHLANFSVAGASTGRRVVRRSGIPLLPSPVPSVLEKVLKCARLPLHQKIPSFGWFLSPRASALPAQPAPCQAVRGQPVIVFP